MATNRSGHVAAGGPKSRNVKHTTAPKVEPRARGINPSGVAQLGALVGDHVTGRGGRSVGYRGEELVRGKGYATPVGVSDPVKAVGVGGGRTLHGQAGQQSQHGPVAGKVQPQGRDILSSFGPESKRS
jgi:hypothetical protein